MADSIEPLQVWKRTDTLKKVEGESFSSVSNSDTLDLANDNVVADAFPSPGKTLVLTVDGNVQDPSNYDLNLDDGEIDYTGSDSGDATVDYRYAPVANSVIQESIDNALAEVENITNTVFGGRNYVSKEVYDSHTYYDHEASERLYTLANRPVQFIGKVEIYDDGWTEMAEGRDQDYIKEGLKGFRFTGNGDTPPNERRAVRVSYEYGYDDIPGGVRDAVVKIVEKALFKDRVHGAGLEGRDDFDPETVNSFRPEIEELVERWRLDRVDQFTQVAERGDIVPSS